MKKIAIVVIYVFLAIILCSCKRNLNIEKGMSYSEFMEQTKGLSLFQFGKYVCYEENNANLVIEFGEHDDNNSIIVNYQRFPKRKVSLKDKDKIKKGMTIYEVVEILGTPSGIVTSGLIVVAFPISYKDMITVQFNDNLVVIG